MRKADTFYTVMSCGVTSPMISLGIDVGVQEQGTNIQVPGRGKQCMQIGNMSLKSSLKHSAREQKSHSATKCSLSHWGEKQKSGKKPKTKQNKQNPFPFLQPSRQ